MDLSSLLSPEILSKGLDVLVNSGIVIGALLSIVGGLHTLSRYTKTEADDKLFASIESVLLKIKDVASKLLPRK